MTDGFLRYYKQERINLDCEVVTPMFLGGADQSAQWRAAPFKAALRKWWRVLQGPQKSWKDLLAEEGDIFGLAGEEGDSGKSRIKVCVSSAAQAVSTQIPKGKTLQHPECERSRHQVAALPYLGGMGIMKPSGEVKHSYFIPRSAFTLGLSFPSARIEMVGSILKLMRIFGTVGARSRNGWGSFGFTQPADMPGSFTVKNWELLLEKDYPSSIGKDQKSPLVWRTAGQQSWESAMADLAEAYIGVRAQELGQDKKLDPGSGKASTRHLLGIPLTSHGTQFGNNARHASPLHFKIFKKSATYTGIILHLPHAHSSEQSFIDTDAQMEVWKIVHRKLDFQKNIISRANLKELLA